MKDIIDAVAIDGPAGSGKSTVARNVAAARGFLYVDTGAMYRALAHKALTLGLDLTNEPALLDMAHATKLEFDASGTHIICDGTDVSQPIRTTLVTNNVKFIARSQPVRAHLVQMQQMMGEQRPVVMEGRDITTVVLPHARWKFFLTASAEARAKRRHGELLAAGSDAEYASVLADINARDASDYQNGPLKDARDLALAGKGIVFLDTSALTPDEVVAAVLERMN